MKLLTREGHTVGCKLNYIPFNRHCHLRYDFGKEGVSTAIFPHIYWQYWGGVVMPNTINPYPITTTKRALDYQRVITQAIPPGVSFQPCMVCYLNEETDLENLESGFLQGVWVAAKTYMAHGKSGTTGSDWGVGDIKGIYPHLTVLQELGMPWLIHGEIHNHKTDIFDREALFIKNVLRQVLRDFPRLNVVLEHITTKEAVNLVFEMNGGVRATITPHHLRFNRNALFDGGRSPFKIGVRPDFFCLPILKEEHHRQELLRAIASGSEWFGAGDDTAAHPEEAKYCRCGCAGCFNSVTSVEWYWEAFLEAGATQYFENFMCLNFLDTYGLEPKSGVFVIEEERWTVPKKCGPVVPIFAGEEMVWKARIAS